MTKTRFSATKPEISQEFLGWGPWGGVRAGLGQGPVVGGGLLEDLRVEVAAKTVLVALGVDLDCAIHGLEARVADAGRLSDSPAPMNLHSGLAALAACLAEPA